MSDRRFRRRLPAAALALAALVSIALPLSADEGAAAPSEDGFYDSVLGLYDFTVPKVTALAEAIPADKYGWRPGEGVRSVSEVFAHVAQAAFFLSSALGTPPPEDLPAKLGELETVTDKAQVQALLGRAIEHARGAIEATRGQDLERKITLFGQEFSARSVVMIIDAHFNEHLGQAIAYARINGVVPPWTAARSEGAADDGEEGPAEDGEAAEEGAEEGAGDGAEGSLR
jgi:uncharacterized damage-inducible protein DinB